MSLVSVIIPCFNAGDWIKEALNSVVEQKMRDLEIIVVDDGSTDGSADIIKEEFSSVRILRTENLGPSKARNLGTRQSDGEFIQYLDADDILAPGKIKVQLEALKSSGLDVAYGDWQRLAKNSAGKFERGEVIKRSLGNPEIDLFTDFWCPPAAYLFRRSIVEKIGGWNEGLPIIQDARFALDCALYGGSFVYCPGIMAYYRMHQAESVSSKDKRAFNSDVLKNTVEVEEWWSSHGGVNEERRHALVTVYGYIIRGNLEKDKNAFDIACAALERLDPKRDVRVHQMHRGFFYKILGYRRTERLALSKRRVKNFLSRAGQRE